MFNVDLQKEMIAGKTKKKGTDLVVQEFNNLITKSCQEDIEVLARIGLNKNIVKAEADIEENRYLSHFDESKIFHIDEIRKICGTYGLRFLSAKHYVGTVDPLLPSEIRKFEKEFSDKFKISDEHGNPIQLNYKYKIMAPRESFKLSERPKDPLIFCCIDKYQIISEKGEYWYLVHKWGNDLSTFRKAFRPFRRVPVMTFLFVIAAYLLMIGVQIKRGKLSDNPLLSETLTSTVLYPLICVLPVLLWICWSIGIECLRDDAFSEFED